MGVSGCYNLLKYFIIFFNFIFWLTGLSILVLAIWMYFFDNTFTISISQNELNYYTGLYILISAGTLMFVAGLLGCCGALRESQCLLVTFVCFLLIIFVAEIAAGAWAYANSDKLEELFRDAVKTTVEKEYDGLSGRSATFDTMQQGLKCCGTNGPTDWSGSRYNNAENAEVSLRLSGPSKTYRIPLSCCNTSPEDALCIGNTEVAIAAAIHPVIFKDGCADMLIEFLKEYFNIFIIVSSVGLVIQLLGMIFSLILCCAVRSEDRYKS